MKQGLFSKPQLALSDYYQKRLASVTSKLEAESILMVYSLLNINGVNSTAKEAKQKQE